MRTWERYADTKDKSIGAGSNSHQASPLDIVSNQLLFTCTDFNELFAGVQQFESLGQGTCEDFF